MRPLRPGVVLVATLLLLVALALLAAGLVWSAEQARLTAAARLDITRARIASESAAAQALAAWSTRRLADLPVGGFMRIPPDSSADAAVSAQHLAGDLYLISARGFGSARGPNGLGSHARASSGALVKILTLRDLWLPYASALGAGRDVQAENSRITGTGAGVVPPGWSGRDCAPSAKDSMLAIFGDTTRPAVTLPPDASLHRSGGSLDGTPTTDAALLDTASFARLGPLSPVTIASVADRIERGSVHPSPSAQLQTCNVAAPANWGDPLDRASPCAGYFPLIFADGDLEITGGAGQGVLVVSGTLEMQGAAQFYGPILVGGSLDTREGAAVYGAARVRGKGAGINLHDATISYSACALFRALRASPALDRPFRPGARWWIPLF